MTVNLGSMAEEEAGLDVWRCELCEHKVRRDQRYITGMDGMHAHPRCVTAYRERERRADAREAREFAALRTDGFAIAKEDERG